MPGPVLHQGAAVTCAHGGQATPTAPVPRVLVSGLPVVTVATPYVVTGCPFVPPEPGPCASAQWVVGAVRVWALGQPVAILTGVAACLPTGTPLLPLVVQTRVVAT